MAETLDGMRRRFRLGWSPQAVVAVALVAVSAIGAMLGWGRLTSSDAVTAMPDRSSQGAPASTSPGLPTPAGATEQPVAASAVTQSGVTTQATTSGSAAETVLVHVAGQVRRPGVVTIPASGRVMDAITAAGGLATKAEPWRINLARPVHDGEQVYVPAAGETDLPTPPAGGAAGTASGSTGPGAAPPAGQLSEASPGVVNINTATAAELQQLEGIGPVLAGRIVTHREQQGPFNVPADLENVSGIGAATMDRLRPQITT